MSMENQPCATNCAQPTGHVSILDILLSPMSLLLVSFLGLYIYQYFDQKKRTSKFEEMLKGIKEGNIVRFKDDTIGEVISIDDAKGFVIISSAGTKMQKTKSSIVEVIE